MIDLRLYQLALFPALAAIVVLMFSLQPLPDPLPPPVSTPDFDGREAARLARSIAETAPTRAPGSTGDAAIADLVEQRFGVIEGGEVAVQGFSSSFDGEDVALENIILTMPSESQEVVLIIAHRDSAAGAGATTSAASTAALVGLADDLGASRQQRTIILASTSGGSDGGTGIRKLVDAIPAPEGFAGVVVLDQMGLEGATNPVIVAPNPTAGSAPARLLETAAALAEPNFGTDAARRGTLGQLARLAIPAALGEGAALADEGVESITITGRGERGETATDEQLADISSETLAALGSLALNLVLTIDAPERSPAASAAPDTYVRAGDNLIPGWSLAILGIALIAPGLLAGVDTWLRERRQAPSVGRKSVPWMAERVLITALPLMLLYLLGFAGLVPDPRFPFEPDRFPFGARGIGLFIALGLTIALVTLLVRPMRAPLDAEPHLLAAAGGATTGLSLLGIWLINPYLGLLLAPLAHLWILGARAAGPPRRGLIVAAHVLALVPLIVAAVIVGSQLELGFGLPWHLLLLLTSGAIGPVVALCLCGLAGGALATFAAARLGSSLT